MKRLALVALLFFAALPLFADSQVRSVRVAYVSGDVQMDRGHGDTRAIMNFPVTSGFVLRTGNDGRAEIEFENKSIVRLAPDSVLRVVNLSLRDNGEKVNVLDIESGTAYFFVSNHGKQEFTVDVAGRRVTVPHNAQFRVEATDEDSATVAVVKGTAMLVGAQGPVSVNKNQTLTIDGSDPADYALAQGVTSEAFDDWSSGEKGTLVSTAAGGGLGACDYCSFGWGATSLGYSRAWWLSDFYGYPLYGYWGSWYLPVGYMPPYYFYRGIPVYPILGYGGWYYPYGPYGYSPYGYSPVYSGHGPIIPHRRPPQPSWRDRVIAQTVTAAANPAPRRVGPPTLAGTPGMTFGGAPRMPRQHGPAVNGFGQRSAPAFGPRPSPGFGRQQPSAPSRAPSFSGGRSGGSTGAAPRFEGSHPGAFGGGGHSGGGPGGGGRSGGSSHPSGGGRDGGRGK